MNAATAQTVSAQPAPTRCTENLPAYATPRAASAAEHATTKNSDSESGTSRNFGTRRSASTATSAPASSGTAYQPNFGGSLKVSTIISELVMAARICGNGWPESQSAWLRH